MMYRKVRFLVGALLLFVSAFAADGTFQGTVVDAPRGQAARPGWIFVEGHNHLLRRVDVSHAVIVLAAGVVPTLRGKCDWECISAGQEIKVTAGQDASGEWRAKRVEILRMAPHSGVYSYLRAIMGSTLVARRAGT
jgi:hypothetical protein